MTVPNAFYRISMKALVLDDKGKFLLSKTIRNKWDLLGGGLDHGELPHEGLSREILEETGLTVTSVAPTPAYFYTGIGRPEHDWRSNVLYETTLEDFDFTPSDECLELRFFSVEEARQEDLLPSVAKFVEMFTLENHVR